MYHNRRRNLKYLYERTERVPLPSPENNYFPLRPCTTTSTTNSNRPETSVSKLRFRSGVVRIRSTVLLRLLLGSVLLPCGIPVAGSAEFDAEVGSVLHQELDEECVRLLVTFRCSVVVSTRIRS
uniref:Revolver-cDNA pSc1 protein n=1 Tax=Secale cereale TaxID=4550 RepID=A5HUA0_SECCE|nr:Revolver-cDNA pSc1 [Secale cereale]